MSIQSFHVFLIVMAVVAVVVFVSLFFVDAGYGKFYNPKWGPAVNNKLGWVESGKDPVEEVLRYLKEYDDQCSR